jgi:hypothetical protein
MEIHATFSRPNQDLNHRPTRLKEQLAMLLPCWQPYFILSHCMVYDSTLGCPMLNFFVCLAPKLNSTSEPPSAYVMCRSKIFIIAMLKSF